MRISNQLLIVNMSLLANTLSGADMGTCARKLSRTEQGAPTVWTAEQHMLGNELIGAAIINNSTRIQDILTQHPLLVHYTRGNWTALMWATHSTTLNTLIAAHADIDVQERDGWTALMLAANGPDKEKVRILLDARADTTLTNNQGKSALAIAQENQLNHRNTRIVELLQNHVPIEPEEETLMVKPAVE